MVTVRQLMRHVADNTLLGESDRGSVTKYFSQRERIEAEVSALDAQIAADKAEIEHLRAEVEALEFRLQAVKNTTHSARIDAAQVIAADKAEIARLNAALATARNDALEEAEKLISADYERDLQKRDDERQLGTVHQANIYNARALARQEGIITIRALRGKSQGASDV